MNFMEVKLQIKKQLIWLQKYPIITVVANLSGQKAPKKETSYGRLGMKFITL